MVVPILIFVIGMHWVILQSVAWTGMIIVYSQTAPLPEALVKTFDGQHPCQLCKVVQAGKQTEQRQTEQKLNTKLDFFCEWRPILICPPTVEPTRFLAQVQPLDWTSVPPIPPPRQLAG